jgi:hypothetical protein
MVLGKVFNYMQKTELDPYTSPYTQVNSKNELKILI